LRIATQDNKKAKTFKSLRHKKVDGMLVFASSILDQVKIIFSWSAWHSVSFLSTSIKKIELQ